MTEELAPNADPHWVELQGGTFWMGSDDFYEEEAPKSEEHVGGFLISKTPITNRQFAKFVADTGYVTVAERPVSEIEFSPSEAIKNEPGSLVFTPTSGPVDLHNWRQWWRWVPGANWRWPRGEGVGPNAEKLADHPVVQIAYEDAIAYAQWVGGRLTTEAEFEYAACGGTHPAPYAWGETRDLNDQVMANTWRGNFPYRNLGARGWIGTSPVGIFPPNGYGLFDSIGNVWEWTSTPYSVRKPAVSCQCGPTRTTEPTRQNGQADHPLLRRVLKGGSHLCAPEYCLRYRPAARSPQHEDSSTTHTGFRVAKDLD